MMREIYEQASRVVVWLGKASADDRKAIQKIRSVYDDLFQHPLIKTRAAQPSDNLQLYKDLINLSEARSQAEWQTVAKFLSKPWFTRAWVMQEATAHPLESDRTTLCCGYQSLNFGCLDTIIRLVSSASLEGLLTDHGTLVNVVLSLSPLIVFGSYRRRSFKLSLLELLILSGCTTVTDPRDTVSCMLPFADDTNTLGNEYKVDYAKSTEEIYANLVTWYLNQHHNLDFLGRCKPVNERNENSLPSWVPDWRDWARYSGNLYDQIGLEERVPLYKTNSGMPRPCLPQTTKRLQALTVSGICISQIEAVSQEYILHMRQSVDTKRRSPLCGLLQTEVLARSLCWDEYSVSNGDFRLNKRGAFVRLTKTAADAALSSEWSPGLVETEEGQFQEQQVFFRLVVAEGADVLGVARSYARSGDELWMLKGGNILYVLRPWQIGDDVRIHHLDASITSPKTPNSTLVLQKGAKVYDLVCEAFVLGLMDGELLKRPRPTCLEHVDYDFRTLHVMDELSLSSGDTMINVPSQPDPGQDGSKAFADVSELFERRLNEYVADHRASVPPTKGRGGYRYQMRVSSTIKISSTLQDQ